MWFVGIVASFVNGAYPEHYDSKLQKRIRRVLTFGIVSMSSIEIVTEEQILQVPMFAYDTTISEQIYLLFVFLYRNTREKTHGFNRGMNPVQFLNPKNRRL
jgi:hypothetical protein